MDVYVESLQRNVRIDEDRPAFEGGEAKLFESPSCPGSLLRLPKRLDDEWVEKSTAMLKSPLAMANIGGGYAKLAWPQGGVYTTTTPREFIGVEIPKIEGCRPLNALWKDRSLCLRDRILVARNIAWAAETIHAEGHAIGDLQPANILVAPNTFVTLIDCDSFQFVTPSRTYRCRVGRGPYLAPELVKLHSLDSVDRTPDHDSWSLAVLTFQLLMQNHPMTAHFVGTGAGMSLLQRIEHGIYPYSRRCDPEYEPSPRVPPTDVLHPDVRALMQRMFIDGHSCPTRRPLVGEWRQILSRVVRNKRYIRRADKLLQDHDAMLHQPQAQPVSAACVSSGTGDWWRSAAICGIVAIGLVVGGVAGVLAYAQSQRSAAPVAPSASASPNEPLLPAGPSSPVHPASYSPKEYGVGRPTPPLWRRLAEEK